MKKIIIWVRSSTDRQTIEDQTKETIEYARSLGYKDEQFVIIGRKGASAYKVSKIYQECLEKMYRTIEEGEVEAVVAWHMNRLARNEVVAMQIKEFLINHHVQLHIKEPSVQLLKDDGTVDQGAELVFSIFATMSKQQAIELKEKSRRGRQRNKEAMIYNGGRIRLGYTLDENKHYVIDPTTSNIVLYIFNKYAKGEATLSQLAEEMTMMGYKYCTSTMRQTLASKEYYDGEKYPPIITKELYDKVQAMAKKNASSAVLESKYHFFLNRLIRCQKCGYGYTVSGRNYRCTKGSSGDHTEHSHQLIPSVMDGLAWQIAYHYESEWLLNDRQRNEETIKSEMAVLALKIEAMDTYKEKVEKRLRRAKEGYLEGILTVGEYKDRVKEVNAEAKEEENRLADMKSQMRIYEDMLHGKKSDWIERIEEVRSNLSLKDEEEMKSIVRKWITKVEVSDDYVVTVTTLDREYHARMKPRDRTGWKWYTLGGLRLVIPRVERDNGIHLEYPKGNVNDVIVTTAWLGGSKIM